MKSDYQISLTSPLCTEALGGDPVVAAARVAADAVAATGRPAPRGCRCAAGDRREQQWDRVDRRVVATDLEVQVGTGRVPGRTDVPDPRPADHVLSDIGSDPRHVPIPARVPEAMLDHDKVAVAAAVVCGVDDRPDTGGADRGPFRLREVDTRVGVPIPRGAERRSDRTGDRPQ